LIASVVSNIDTFGEPGAAAHPHPTVLSGWLLLGNGPVAVQTGSRTPVATVFRTGTREWVVPKDDSLQVQSWVIGSFTIPSAGQTRLQRPVTGSISIPWAAHEVLHSPLMISLGGTQFVFGMHEFVFGFQVSLA
jgi:hypothetical protein